MCVTVDGSRDICRGRKHPNYFGDCFVCNYDGCNGEETVNGSIIKSLNHQIAKMIVCFNIFEIFKLIK